MAVGPLASQRAAAPAPTSLHAPGSRGATDGDGIRVAGVSVTYPGGNRALSDASLSVPRGSITALLGVNGSGKSTLFKAIMGLVSLGGGSVTLLGLPVTQALRQGLVAYVPQSEAVDWTFPVLVEDVVMMGRYGHMGLMRRPRAADRAAVDLALARVGLSDLRHRQIGALSGGQRKRAFVARALAQDAQVILLDEPFTGVDAVTEDQIVSLLSGLRDEGRVLLVSTHDLGAVPGFCDRVAMVKGTVLAEGPTETTFTPANLEATFGGVLRRITLPATVPGGAQTTILTDDERPFVYESRNEAAR